MLLDLFWKASQLLLWGITLIPKSDTESDTYTHSHTKLKAKITNKHRTYKVVWLETPTTPEGLFPYGRTDGSALSKPGSWKRQKTLCGFWLFSCTLEGVKEIGQITKLSEAFLKLSEFVTLEDPGHWTSSPLLQGAPSERGAPTPPFFSLFLQVVL